MLESEERWGPSCSLPTFKEQQTDDMIRVPRGTSVLQHNIGRCSKLLMFMPADWLAGKVAHSSFALIAAQRMCVDGEQIYN